MHAWRTDADSSLHRARGIVSGVDGLSQLHMHEHHFKIHQSLRCNSRNTASEVTLAELERISISQGKLRKR